MAGNTATSLVDYSADGIDRTGPTRRPKERAIGFHVWKSLLFMHWPLPAEQLRPLIPAPLELDLCGGQAYLGLVPFELEQVRPWWWPQGSGLRFLETNVRTYVHHNGRPGVYFISLDASSLAAVWAARLGWSLPYYHAQMSLDRRGDLLHYASRRTSSGARHESRCRVGDHLGPSQPGTIEHFLLERYYLFSMRRGELLCGQVHHTPYPARLAHTLDVQDGLAAANGLPPLVGPPALTHFAERVDVDIFPLRRVSAS